MISKASKGVFDDVDESISKHKLPFDASDGLSASKESKLARLSADTAGKGHAAAARESSSNNSSPIAITTDKTGDAADQVKNHSPQASSLAQQMASGGSKSPRQSDPTPGAVTASQQRASAKATVPYSSWMSSKEIEAELKKLGGRPTSLENKLPIVELLNF